jgi:diaminopropionate ammonia-lyase
MFSINKRKAGALSRVDVDLGPKAAGRVIGLLKHCPAYRATPLRTLGKLAERLGIGELWIKDESERFGLGSFKALGGAYAVVKLVLDRAALRLGRVVSPAELRSAAVRAIASELTVACATDGNHGRSIAAGARFAGCRAVVFTHVGVSKARVAAIQNLGAVVISVAGTYDDSVQESRLACAANDWLLVSDTSWSGYEKVPTLVMQGYTVMASEALSEAPQAPTHLFLQAGVGGLAAAVAGYIDRAGLQPRPRMIVVEPELADCFFQSNAAAKRVKVHNQRPTVMSMLECYEPSLIAWRILSQLADAFLTISDAEAVEAMIRLSSPEGGDPAVVAGESGGAGLAGLIHAACREEIRSAIGLDERSRVLVFNTEGATDPERYSALVGRTHDQVRMNT